MSVKDNMTLSVKALTVDSFLSEFCFKRPKKPNARLSRINTKRLVINTFARDTIISQKNFLRLWTVGLYYTTTIMRALLSIICLLLGCALLINLGLWQLKRGGEKEEITSLYDQRKKAVPTQLLEQGGLGPTETTIWTNYQLSGRFLNGMASCSCYEILPCLPEHQLAPGRRPHGQGNRRYLTMCQRSESLHHRQSRREERHCRKPEK